VSLLRLRTIRCVCKYYPEVCACSDIVGDMTANLSVPRSRPRLVEKIVELGLVSDRRELRRKRQKKDGSGDGAKNNRGRRKNGNNFTELADLVSDEHSSSDSMCLLSHLSQTTSVTVAMYLGKVWKILENVVLAWNMQMFLALVIPLLNCCSFSAIIVGN